MGDWILVSYFGVGAVAFIIAACCYTPPNGSYVHYERDWSVEWTAFFLWPLYAIFFAVLIVACLIHKPN